MGRFIGHYCTGNSLAAERQKVANKNRKMQQYNVDGVKLSGGQRPPHNAFTTGNPFSGTNYLELV